MPPTEANGSAATGGNFRDDAARALRAVFSSDDNWPNLSEAERDEWRGYFDRMLERLGTLAGQCYWSVGRLVRTASKRRLPSERIEFWSAMAIGEYRPGRIDTDSTV